MLTARMKKIIRFCAPAAAALLAVSSLCAQPAPASPASTASTATPDAPAPPELYEREGDSTKYVLACTLKSMATNEEFQKNVETLRNQRQLMVTLDQRQKVAITQPEKEALKASIKALEEKLRENENTMRKEYGFSLTRDYLLQIATSRVYVLLSEDDYKKLSEEDKKKPDYIISRPGTGEDGKETTFHFRQEAVVEGIEANENLNNEIRAINELRQNKNQLEIILKRPELQKTTNAALRKKYETDLAYVTDAYLKKTDEAFKTYKFSFVSTIYLRYELTHLRIALDEKGYADFLAKKKALAATTDKK
ncbi:MAG: hypothetical protein LBG65_01810 [Puniceicoccales bacterium]|jgi:hypothetical protein|nr:hypothetical protein [Puniceicoccales bacterium]